MTTRTKKITLTTWTGRSFATRQKRTRKQCKCNDVLLVILLPSAAFNRVNTVTQRPSCSESLSAATACERKDIVSHSSITLSFRNSPCGLPAFTGSIATYTGVSAPEETKQNKKTVILLPFQATLYKHHRLLPRLIDMGPFLERPGDFSGPKANFHQNQNLLNSGTVPRSQTSQFYFIVNS